MQKVFPEYEYLSIEDPVARLHFAGLTAEQWQDLYPVAILDEVQKMLTGGWQDRVEQLPPSFIIREGYAEKQRVFEQYLRFGAYPAISDRKPEDTEKDDWGDTICSNPEKRRNDRI